MALVPSRLVAVLWMPLVVAACGPVLERSGGGVSSQDGGVDQALPTGCVGLDCHKVICNNGSVSTITGKVTAPNGIDPVPDALVYLATAVTPFSNTIACEACAESAGGTPYMSTQTKVDGTFVLSDVPVGVDIPLVVQKGRFRRRIAIDAVACTETKLTVEQTRLPKNKSEGDLPQIALALGAIQ